VLAWALNPAEEANLGGLAATRKDPSMLALLAVVGALVVALLLWRTFAGQRIGVPSTPRRAPVAPDDDPDFLRQLAEQQRKRRADDGDA